MSPRSEESASERHLKVVGEQLTDGLRDASLFFVVDRNVDRSRAKGERMVVMMWTAGESSEWNLQAVWISPDVLDQNVRTRK